MSAYSDLILATPGLVAYWRLGEPSGSTAVDAAAGHDGAINAATLGVPGLLAGDSDTAFSFTSFGQRVIIPDDVAFHTDHFSVELWFRMPVLTTSLPFFNITGSTDPMYSVESGDAPDRVDFYIYTDSLKRLVTEGWTEDTIHHLVATYDGHHSRVYRDGAIVGTSSTDYNAAQTYPTSPVIRIGMFVFTKSFEGTLDEVAVYNLALDDATIAAHYDMGVNGPPSSGFDSVQLARFRVSSRMGVR